MLEDKLNVINKLIASAEFSAADREINPLINQHPQNAKLWNIKAITTKNLGRLKDTLFCLNKSLSADPNYKPALLGLANLQSTNSWFKESIESFNKILDLDSKNSEALFGKGHSLNQRGNFAEAIKVLETANLLDNRNVNIKIAYGQSLLNLDKNDEAIKLFDDVLLIEGHNLAALNNKAVALKKKCEWQAAIECLKTANSLSKDKPEIIKNLASCYTLTGDFETSKRLYQKAIQINPQDMDAHHWLNKMLWEIKDADFLESYKHSLEKAPNSLELLFNFAHKLHLAKNLKESKSALEKCLKINSKYVPALIELGIIYREMNQLEQSHKVLLQALSLADQHPIVLEELAISFISCDQPLKAIEILNKLLETDSTKQSWLAYKATALKLANSSEYDYLCNYDFVLATEINIPKGFSSLSEFNTELVATLREYHHSKIHPLDQSLISGSQTSEKLFDFHVPIIQSLRESFREQTLPFLASLPKDKNHPVFKLNTLDYVETDSWSVILHNSGFHKNHHHPAGWYSGPYYAQVPTQVSGSDSKQGWVKLGQPGFNMMSKLEPDVIIEPKNSMMIRFPSYFWHGTIPFTSEQERITVPCDIIPK